MKLNFSILILIIFAVAYSVLGKDKLNQNIIGNWELDIMRDTMGIPFDVAINGEGMPDIFPYLKIKKDGKAILRNGETEYKAIWNLIKDSISFTLKNNKILSFKIHSLNENELVIDYVEGQGENKQFLGYVYYKPQ